MIRQPVERQRQHDAAALEGLLRILSLLGLGVALIAIGWAYGKVLRRPAASDGPIPAD